MQISKRGVKFISDWEGFRDKVYLDVGGKPTIGFGHLLTKQEIENDIFKDGISKKKALKLLQKDTSWAEKVVNNHVNVPLTQNQFDALVSFVYNLGSYNFQKSTLLRKLNQKNYKDTAEEFLKWVYVNRMKIKGLENRRKAEKELFLSEEQDDNTVVD